MDMIKKVFANGMRISGLVACLIYGYHFFARKGIGDFKFYSISVGLVAFITLISFFLRKIDEGDNVILFKISKWSTTILLIPLFMAITESDLQAQAFVSVLFFTIIFAIIMGIIKIFAYFKRCRDIDKRLDELEEEFDMSNLSAEERAEAHKNWINQVAKLEEEKARKEKDRIEIMSERKEPSQREKSSKTQSTEEKKPGIFERSWRAATNQAAENSEKDNAFREKLAMERREREERLRKEREIQIALEAEQRAKRDAEKQAKKDAELAKRRAEAEAKEAAKCYCKLCGKEFPTVKTMATSSGCPGNGRGKHEPYNGPKCTKYYCEYCGKEYPSIQALVNRNNACARSPNKRHSPYEGGEKKEYTCSCCGNRYRTLSQLLNPNNKCTKNNYNSHIPMR